MSQKTKTAVAWSGGKDCSLALDIMRRKSGTKLEILFTTVSEDHRRISIHGVRESLLERQAEKIGLPVKKIPVPTNCSEERYESIIRDVLEDLEKEVDAIVYSDIYLEGVRKKREDRLKELDLEGIWPLWGRDTSALSEEIASRFEAYTVCVNSKDLDRRYTGRRYDSDFLTSLPEETDLCGEDGEFHTFVCDGPFFESSVEIEFGDTVEKNPGESRFYYSDIRARD